MPVHFIESVGFPVMILRQENQCIRFSALKELLLSQQRSKISVSTAKHPVGVSRVKIRLSQALLKKALSHPAKL